MNRIYKVAFLISFTGFATGAVAQADTLAELNARQEALKAQLAEMDAHSDEMNETVTQLSKSMAVAMADLSDVGKELSREDRAAIAKQSCSRASDVAAADHAAYIAPLQKFIRSESKQVSFCANPKHTTEKLLAEAESAKQLSARFQGAFGSKEGSELAYYYKILAKRSVAFCAHVKNGNDSLTLRYEAKGLLNLLEKNIHPTGVRLSQASCGQPSSNSETASQVIAKAFGPETLLNASRMRINPITGERTVEHFDYENAPGAGISLIAR
ncbi:MAG: hypothetical protein ACXWP5_16440 [Bdellovibrionota bacterium]